VLTYLKVLVRQATAAQTGSASRANVEVAQCLDGRRLRATSPWRASDVLLVVGTLSNSCTSPSLYYILIFILAKA